MSNKKNDNQISKKKNVSSGKGTEKSPSVSKNVKKVKAKIKKSKGLSITLICIVLIVAIVLGSLYIFAPDTFNKIFGINNNEGALPPTDLVGEILQVHYVDIGQGDCIIIKFPDGKNMIMDAGTKGNPGRVYDDVLKPYIDNLKIKTFDYMFLTHTDGDHVYYLDDVLRDYEVKEVFRPAFRSKSENKDINFSLVDSNVFDDFTRAVANEPDIKVNYNIGKQKIEGDNYVFDFYCAEEELYKITNTDNALAMNRVSPISILSYGGRKLVFTGDAEGKVGNGGNGAENIFMENVGNPIDCDVLKVGHHGSSSSSSEEFLQFIDPEYAVVSVGKNSYGHPSDSFLSRINNYKEKDKSIEDMDFNKIEKLYNTRNDGNILLRVASNSGLQFDTIASNFYI